MVIRLQPATLENAKTIFEWRNDPWIVALGSTGKTVSWEEHCTWFNETLTSHDRRMFIVLHDDERIGQVRFDRLAHDTCEISIYLICEYTGRGFGVRALQQACKEVFSMWDVDRILAFVQTNNRPSLSAFKKAGFVESSTPQISAKPECIGLCLARQFRVPHNRLTFGEEEVQAVAQAVASGRWASGPRVIALEQALAQRAQTTYAAAVSSGLTALRLTLKGLGVGPGDEVIVPAYSCVAMANATLALGAKVVPVDVRETDWNIDPQLVNLAVTPRTRAIVLVNTFGAPAPIENLRHLGIPLIEDCAHGFGLPLGENILGNRGDVAILSFYATKLIGAGEGGAVLTNKRELAEFVCAWRDYADQLPDASRLNDKMNDLEAALAGCQLARLDSMFAERNRAAQRYHERLSSIAEHTRAFQVPKPSEARVWYRYIIEMKSALASVVVKRLRQYGIHAESPIADWGSGALSSAPVAERAYKQLVSLPLYPTLQLEEQEAVCNALRAVLEEIADV